MVGSGGTVNLEHFRKCVLERIAFTHAVSDDKLHRHCQKMPKTNLKQLKAVFDKAVKAERFSESNL